MIYDQDTGQYLPKLTSLSLYLVSFRNPDEEKLVGRVVIDLASVLNSKEFSEAGSHKMDYCSVKDACLHFSINNTAVEVSEMKQS